MKKLLFVLIAVIACSCAKDPRDEICGEYSCIRRVDVVEYTKTLYGNRVVKNENTTYEEEFNITITKCPLNDRLLYIMDDKDFKSVKMSAIISENGKMLCPVNADVHTDFTDIYWSNIHVAGDVLIFTERWHSEGEYYEEQYGERICETTTITAEYTATKIKEQD